MEVVPLEVRAVLAGNDSGAIRLGVTHCSRYETRKSLMS